MLYEIIIWLTGIEMMTEMKTLVLIIRAATDADQRRFNGQMISR